MLPIETTHYTPVLRLKKGEYTGLESLANEVKDFVLPYLVLPPPDDPDPELRRHLKKEELINEHGARIGKHWRLRPCIVDHRFLRDTLGGEAAGVWLPELYDVIARAHGMAMPCLGLNAHSEECRGVGIVLRKYNTGMCLRLALADLADAAVATRSQRLLLSLGVKPSETVLILDLSDLSLDSPEMVSDTVLELVHNAQNIGTWRRIIFTGTHYPEANPAPKNGAVRHPRNEWICWLNLMSKDPELVGQVYYGDFSADSAKFSFGGKGRAAIPHLRYTLKDEWLIVRGGPAQLDSEGAVICDGTIRSVARGIVSSGDFYGAEFSDADDFIYNCSRGEGGPGNSTTWRKVNTTHHITMVVAELAERAGTKLPRRVSQPRYEQLTFDEL
ncbi:beta family protein [Microvirga puerhi]|uniref:Beta family protein n=1 Tax=Microvirga puerhi TaxID=2876078 RepID=A0ABS7VSI2_9HYPH|nr:beta family protein [Microvirga puerhi]MBZ6078159.1 beta family protein [Microvirga puerhi]